MSRLPSLVLAILVALWTTCPSPVAATPVLPPVESVDELLDRIEDQGDDVHPGTFDTLAAIGTPEAFEASCDAIAAVKKEGKLNRAYQALARYERRALRDAALALCSKDAHRHRRAFNRRAATRGLVAFGADAQGPLQEIVRGHKEDEVRAIAVWAVLDPLAEVGDLASLELLLDHANPDKRGRREDLLGAVARFEEGEAAARLLELLLDPKASRAWRQLVLEVVRERTGKRVDQTLAELAGAKDPGLALQAVELLGERRVGRAEADVRRHLRSKDEGLLRAAVVALTNLVGDRDAWREEVHGLAADSRPAARMGAAVALADLRTGPDLELLHGLVTDTNHAVRLTALREVASLRRGDGVSLLIERMAVETGTVQEQIGTMLRLMTGEDMGIASRWKRWWDDVGAGFELPDYEEALAKERRREVPVEDRGTQASFYGLRIISDRVCFVLDTSGSMAAEARMPGERSSTNGGQSTRMEVAKFKLGEALDRFPEGDRFNVVFFDDDVDRLEDELIEMTSRNLAATKKYVKKAKPGGGTAVYDALDAAFDDDEVDTIYLLTDGDPSAGRIVNAERIAEAIERRNRTRLVTIHCISIGKPSPLLRRLAADSGGTYVEVR